jgi:hypothetical protein
MKDAEQASAERTTCLIQVQLADGECIDARVHGDRETARAELAGVHGRLDAQTFVLVGEDTIVRSQEVRFVRLRGEDESETGVFETIKSKLGGNGMSSYEAQQRRGVDDREGRERGFTEQWVGYGNRPWAETKPFFLTSEFLMAGVLIVGILIATAMNDNLDAPRGWLYAAIVAAAYIVSRGLAKSGTGDPNPERFGKGPQQ